MHNKTKHQKQKGTHSEREATLRKKDEVPTGRNEGKQQKERERERDGCKGLMLRFSSHFKFLHPSN